MVEGQTAASFRSTHAEPKCKYVTVRVERTSVKINVLVWYLVTVLTRFCALALDALNNQT